MLADCPLVPGLRGWTAETLARDFGDAPLETVWAPPSRRFTVFWNRGTYADRSRTADKYAAYESPPTNGNEYRTLRWFLDRAAEANAGTYGDGKARYLQQCLGARPDPSGAFAHDGKVPPALRRDLESLDGGLLATLGAAAGFGAHMKTKLYVGPRGACSRCHCDGYDGLIVQLEGRKRVVLFDPLEARHLCVFPQHHGLELRPRVHVDAPDYARFPRYARATACSAVLGPGDVLYLPHHWWHHIECLSDTTVSANLWLSTGGEAGAAALWRSLPKPLGPGWTYELARHVELAVAAGLPGGGADVPGFLRHCAGELAAVDNPSVPPLWHALRCRLFAKLASFLGAAALPAFFDDLLDPARFDGIAPVEPEMAFTDVPGREHVCPGAPVYRPLPS